MGTSRLPGLLQDAQSPSGSGAWPEQLEVDSDELDGLGGGGTLPLANAGRD